MKYKFLLIYSLITVYCGSISASSADTLLQRFNQYVSLQSPEKLYLHIDRNYYSTGETIWFKGYLANASYESCLPLSKYIYVELLGDSIVLRAKVKEDKNGFAGHFIIPDTLSSGNYILRAYTRWQMNYPPEYMFYTNIQIYGTGKEASQTTIRQQNFDISFYPEGGRYFAGQRSVIGLKAMNEKGVFVNIKGTLQDSKGNIITPVRTEHNGMGILIFIPEKGENYTIKTQDANGCEYSFALPVTSETGGTINITHNSGAYYISAFYIPEQNILPDKTPVYLLLHNGSEMQILADMKQNNGTPVKKTIKVEEEKLAQGINHALLVNSNGQVLSERMFYVYPHCTQTVTIQLALDKGFYQNREKISARVQLIDGYGNPVEGNFSAAVVKGIFKEYQQEDNIQSYMLLSSELKGNIYRPAYYFDLSIPEKQRKVNMDMLMLIQGWRYYDLPDLLSQKTTGINQEYSKELTQRISGQIQSRNSGKMQKYSFSIIAPSIGYSCLCEAVTGDYFIIDSLDFLEGTLFYAINPERGKDRFIWDKEIFPEYNASSYNEKPRISNTTEKRTTPLTEEPFGNDIVQGDTLMPVVVRESYFYKSVSSHLSPLGQMAFERRQVKTRNDMKISDNLPIIDYIITNFRIGNKSTNGFEEKIIATKQISLWKSGNPGALEPMLYIDGIKQPGTNMLKGISVSDVETLVVLRGTEGALYNCIHGVILIELRNARTSSRQESTATSNIARNTITPLGYQQPIRFYAPAYDTPQKINSPVPDLRNTLYWNPMIKTDIHGKALLEFYTSDEINEPYLIRIEGVSSDNRYIYWEGEVPLK